MLKDKTMEFMLYLIYVDSCNIPGLIIQDEAAKMQAGVREGVQAMLQNLRHHIIFPKLRVMQNIPDIILHPTPHGGTE